MHTEKQAITSLFTFTDGGGQQIQNSIYLTLHTLIDVHILTCCCGFSFVKVNLNRRESHLSGTWVSERERDRGRDNGGVIQAH